MVKGDFNGDPTRVQIDLRPPTKKRIYVLTEFPSKEELFRNIPFCGSVGHAFDKMLAEAGLERSDCYFSFVTCEALPAGQTKIDGYYPKTKRDTIFNFHQHLHDRWVHPKIASSQDRLAAEIEAVSPEVIICLGNASLHSLLGQWGIQAWRGSIADYRGIPVLATYSPQYIFRVWSDRPVVIADLRRVRRILDEGVAKEPDWDFIIAPDFHRVDECLSTILEGLAAAKSPQPIACDIETRGGHINCIGLAWTTTEAITIPLISLECPGGYYDTAQEGRIVHLLYRILTHANAQIIGQNFSYDTQYIFRAWHFLAVNVEDTMVMQHTLYPGMEKGLGFLSSLHAESHVYWKDEGKLWHPGMPETQHWEYNAKDCCRTLEVFYSLRATLEKDGLTEQYNHKMKRWWKSIMRTVLRGVKVDEYARKQLQLRLFKEIQVAQAKVNRLAGHPLNVKSSPQMKTFFYEDMGQKIVYAKKPNSQGRKPPTCNSDALDVIMEREPILAPLCIAIQELRSLGVFYSTFALAKLDWDRRMRTDYNVAGTETIRLSSRTNPFGSGMNMQNVPKGDEKDEGDLIAFYKHDEDD